MKRILLLLSIGLIMASGLKAQIDTEFWFAVPHISHTHDHIPIKICLVSQESPIVVTIAQPASNAFTPIVVSMGANEYREVNMTSFERVFEAAYHNNGVQTYDTIMNRGLHITSQGGKVAVYYQFSNNNSELYLLKGSNALGLDFIVPSQYTSPVMSWVNAHNSIEIVATEDNTIVTIIPTQRLTSGHLANVPYSVTLMRGQTYSIAAEREFNHSLTGNKHLRGTRITSNKPIAVNTTDDSVAFDSSGSGGYDLIGEQIVPIALTGTSYIAVRNTDKKSNSQFVDRVYVFPTEPNTTVNFYTNGGAPTIRTLQTIGDEICFPLSTDATYISSNKPVIVFQMISSETGGKSKLELGGTQLPQIECTGVNKVMFSAVNSASPIVNVICKTEDVAYFVSSGFSPALVANDFTQVPGNANWSYCRKSVSLNSNSYSSYWQWPTNISPAISTATIENTRGYFHLAVADENQSTCSYAYYSNYNEAATISLIKNKDNYCLGDSLILTTHDILAIDTLIWTLPDGSILRRHKNEPYVISELGAEHIGYYSVDGINRFGCGVLSDGFDLTLHPHKMSLRIDTICESDLPYNLDGFVIETAGEHILNYNTSKGCDSIVTLNLTTERVVDLYDSTTICINELPTIINGIKVMNPGDYSRVITSSRGCSYNYYLNVSSLPQYNENISKAICDN